VSAAKKDLARLADFLNTELGQHEDPSTAVECAIDLLELMVTIKPSEVAQGDVVREPQVITLVASNKAKQGSQPWSEWDKPLDDTVRELFERTADNPNKVGFQYEVIEAVVTERVTIETIVNVRGS
jgi:hypothetical protein